MGMYRIPIRPGKFELIPQIVQSLGLPIIRIEHQENGVDYIYANPKRLNRYWKFRISHEKAGSAHFFMCGLSKISKRVVLCLNAEGVLGSDHLEQDVFSVRRRK
jgi:hypothetical protein